MPPRDRAPSFAGFIADPGTQQTEGVLPTITSRLNALGQKLGVTIFGISGYRTPAHSVAVGGFANDPHTQGAAEDIGVNSQLRSSASGISEAELESVGLTRPFGGASEVNHIQLLPGATRANRVGAGSLNTSIVPSYVPKAYRGWVRTASQQTGLSGAIVAAQINDESGFDPSVTSPTGAEGIAQFEPGTWKTYGKGDPYDPQAALPAYIALMSALLAQYHGNVRDALAAYNAGSGNISAGYGYADSILSRAGAPRTATAGGASKFSGTRPGGQSTDSSGAPADTGEAVTKLFTDYQSEVDTPRSAPVSSFTPVSQAGWRAPFQWWWQSFSGNYNQENQSG